MDLDELKKFLKIDGEDLDVVLMGYQLGAEEYLKNAGVTVNYESKLYKVVITIIVGTFLENPILMEARGTPGSLGMTINTLITQLALSGPITDVPSIFTTVTADYAVLKTDNTIKADTTASPILLTMPSANTCANGHEFDIKKIDGSTNTVTVGGVIDDSLSVVLTVKNQSITLKADVVNNQYWIV